MLAIVRDIPQSHSTTCAARLAPPGRAQPEDTVAGGVKRPVDPLPKREVLHVCPATQIATNGTWTSQPFSQWGHRCRPRVCRGSCVRPGTCCCDRNAPAGTAPWVRSASCLEPSQMRECEGLCSREAAEIGSGSCPVTNPPTSSRWPRRWSNLSPKSKAATGAHARPRQRHLP